MGTTAPLGEKKFSRVGILAAVVAALIVIGGLVAVFARLPQSSTPAKPTGSTTATGTKGANMAGAQQDVFISQAAINARPVPWDLSTPQRAIASYLAWTSYAYRTATSSYATPTMGPDQGVRVDSYIQLNLQQSRLLDQHLDSLTFGTASKTGTSTLVPAKEKWTYSYLSIAKGAKVLGGPFSASYETTYTLSKTAKGWVVMSIAVTPIGTVK